MLIQFNFKNYKSFRDEATLDMTAVNDIEDFSERIVSVANEKLLSVAAIYGANASGKSNVYSAFKYMTNYVKESFAYGDDEEFSSKRLPVPFLFDSASAKAETSFEVYFVIDGGRVGKYYNYGFCVNRKGITEEWLNVKTSDAAEYSRVFYRYTADGTLDLDGFSNDRRRFIKLSLAKEALIISLGAKLKIRECKEVREWFAANQLVDFADLGEYKHLFRRLPHNFGEDKAVQKRVVEYLATFDNHIQDFKAKRITSPDINNGKRTYKIHSVHKMIDSSETTEIPLEDESAGTLKMFALYPDLQKVLKSGSVLFVDELNARLHPLLVRDFLLTFLNPKINTNHAQLIFTTHDTWQMKKDFLRKDEIWFTEKDEQGLSSLYSLADFTELGDGDFESKYLFGEFGAIPSLSSIKKEGE